MLDDVSVWWRTTGVIQFFPSVKKFKNKNQGDQDGVRCGAWPYQGGRQHSRHPHLAGDFRATWHDVADSRLTLRKQRVRMWFCFQWAPRTMELTPKTKRLTSGSHFDLSLISWWPQHPSQELHRGHEATRGLRLSAQSAVGLPVFGAWEIRHHRWPDMLWY